MTSFTQQNMGKYTYLNISESFWDKDKKIPDNNKTRIGKIDRETGQTYYKPEYIAQLKAEGKDVQGMLVWEDQRRGPRRPAASSVETESVAAEILDSVRDYGTTYFLESVAREIGLLDVLKNALPECWEQVFTLASFLIAENKPIMYCEDWRAANVCMNVGTMSSQRISELLVNFGYAQRAAFYKQWYSLIREKEYIAMDITSMSCYSQQIQACEWGYNRDKEDLPQVNLCMLFGEMSRLPVYQTVYSGSLKDVSTLNSTLREFAAMAGTTDLMLVTDKGFFSERNVKMLLNNPDGVRFNFLMAVPFTNSFAKRQVESERKDIDSIHNVILTRTSPIRGVHKLRAWKNDIKLHTHIFYDPQKATTDRNELYGHVARLKTLAMADPDNEKAQKDFRHYLIVRKSGESGHTVNVREDVLAEELRTAGWLVLLSNHIDNAQQALNIYRDKDVIEKSFDKFKNNLGLNRLRVHGDERMENKLFVAFIALILTSHIYKVMAVKDISDMTFNKLMLTMAKIKSATVAKKMILRPLTKEQRQLFETFRFALPDPEGHKQVEREENKRPPAPPKNDSPVK